MYKAKSFQYDSNEELAKYAADPDCSNAKECLELLNIRKEAEQIRRSKVREELQSNPFDPRNEVSADARHIAKQVVKHLWIIFVALPFVLGVLYSIYSILIK